MRAIRIIFLHTLFFITIFTGYGNILAQQQVSDSALFGMQQIDTSEYIPYFYAGALDYNLMIAASKGYSSEIIRLVELGADVDAVTDEGATPIIFAITNENLETIKTLLEYGPELNFVTRTFDTPLLLAVKMQNFDITEALIRAGAEIDYPDKHGATPLNHAALYGYFDIVDLLLYYDASIDSKSDAGTTPLLASIWAGHPEVADLLIQRGADIEEMDNDGFTPFLMASFYGDTLMMSLLFRKGADIYATNNIQHNALTLSILANHIEATKLLFRIGDNWADPTNNAVNPYSVVSKYRRKEMINLLEEYKIPGQVKYGIDQMSVSTSARFCLHDLYTGLSVSFKEPYLNGGLIFGVDTKLWYSRVLIKNNEYSYTQYLDRSTMAYAGLFKDFALSDRPDKFNSLISGSLLAGYSLGNVFKGTQNSPGGKFVVIPTLTYKLTKMNFTFSLGAEYIKTALYKDGPVWIRIGCSYNYYFDKVRTLIRNINWY